jgi:hypothetical protein
MAPAKPAFRLVSQSLTETSTIKACLDLLNIRGYWAQRVPAGVWYSYDRKRCISVPKGLPDFLVLHGSKPGFLLETKRPHGGTLSPDQERMQRNLKMGYKLRVCTAQTAGELVKWLEENEGGRA